MALSDDILTILFNYSGGYKLMRQQLLNPSKPQWRKYSEIKQETLYVTMARLQERGLVEKKHSLWKITEKGRKFLHKRLSKIMPPHSPSLKEKKKTPFQKNMIIVFDIPEKLRKKRDWLRTELRLLEFSPIQKSVWLGPAPLPQSFIKSITELKIIRYLKFFEAKEKDIIQYDENKIAPLL